MKKILYVFALLLTAGGVHGYEFQVSPVQEIAALEESQSRLDMNGLECGLLLVESQIPSLDFQMSAIGGCGVEKTTQGYAVYLGQGARYVTLAAPGFKPFRWEFDMPSGVIKEKQYAAQVGTAGVNPDTFSASDMEIRGSLRRETFGLVARFMGGGQSVLKIHTDLPFSALEDTLLIPGSYTVKEETESAPYYLYLKAGTPFQNIVRKDVLKGDIAWETPLEGKTDYQLDLTWGFNPQQKTREVKAQLKNILP